MYHSHTRNAHVLLLTVILGLTARTPAAQDQGFGQTHAVLSASFSPDGARIVTACRDHTARVWDAGDGEELMRLKGHEDEVSSASFSPDGSRIVTASFDN